ncbi:starch phosphorylase [Serratia fonticola]|jgi:starch phosphorylase|uniref:Alpha-1,4 glucan phosphorylase n=1 Tax=Serratia fonticola TaxID=47917 RepID=A0A559T838_SERFO|nr:glycogen/starch/alpha-glucan phosphorylase [Serratia fonticola]TQI81706.1 starch phosphorylase [Serratia fonticola]TQI96270.1 starch phosphorylase [Serratia fonticola]TVZ70768.1 starch phosphorylase [Serratia fonticola]
MNTKPSRIEMPGVEEIKNNLISKLRYVLCLERQDATSADIFNALALALRDYQLDSFFSTQRCRQEAHPKRLYYLSMEFLLGQSLRNNAMNLGLLPAVKQVVSELGFDFDEIIAQEPDAALGNGGLGRLAACFIDSMATLDIAASGHGIKYEYGLFKQSIQNGKQVEQPDDWHATHSPWLIDHHSQLMLIPIGGHIEESEDIDGNYNPMWMDWKVIVGVPHDYFVTGYGGNTVNKLRLYSASASDSFDVHIFNRGDYLRAVSQKIASENISKILYPADEIPSGKELRLTQEYFLVACTLRDIFQEYAQRSDDITGLPDAVAIQLNDTHPALTIVEMMRTLVDEHRLDWDLAWRITQKTCAFTNHTLMPEALETWPVALFEKLLPRHLQILYEINYRFLAEVAEKWPDKPELLASLSLFEEGAEKKIRMANLAIVGSHKVNGVAKLHSELIKQQLVPHFYFISPEKFTNQTNGVTPRRWIQQANPGLADFLTRQLGPSWVTDLDQLQQLKKLAKDSAALEKIQSIKLHNKQALCRLIAAQQGIKIDPSALFDSQVKRIHEYKRQLLNILHVIHLYLGIVESGKTQMQPKVHLFSGKAAPGYAMAKLIVQLINEVASTVNSDPRAKGQLNVLFLEDYKVSLAEHIIPATDLSEQISTAGTEASGTSNMKFAMNGALTIGTMDGANIEIRDAVGADNFYLFGANAAEIDTHRQTGDHNQIYPDNLAIREAVDALVSGRFHPDTSLFQPIYRMLTTGDHYCHLLDFDSYRLAQHQALEDFCQPQQWHQRALLNIAGMGGFSSDRTIKGYASEIWGIPCGS